MSKAKHRLKDFEHTLVIPGGTVVWQPIGFCRRVGKYGDKWDLEPIDQGPIYQDEDE